MSFTGNNIRAEMGRNRMTVRDVASIAGISDTSFHKKINGEREFTLVELCRLADRFSVSIDYLVERDTGTGKN